MNIRELEKELGLDEALAMEGSLVRVRLDTRRYGKSVTILGGFDTSVDLGALAKRLKHRLGTGGTARDGTIELQGDHRREVRALLEAEGFPVES